MTIVTIEIEFDTDLDNPMRDSTLREAVYQYLEELIADDTLDYSVKERDNDQ